jgi:transposase-like protein
MDALLMKSQSIAHKKIAQIIGICPNTLRSYLREYQKGGFPKIKELNFYQPQSELGQHRQTLEKYLSLASDS